MATARLTRRAGPLIGALAVVLFLLGGGFPEDAATEQASHPGSPSAGLLDAGREHTCSVVDGGAAVRCWGWKGNGRLGYPGADVIGDDETPGSAGPVDLGAGGKAIALTAGAAHTCALLESATVRCWGFAADGQLGYGNTNTVGDDEPPGGAGPVSLGAGRTAIAITAGDYHTCAVLDDGTVRCWGSTFYGQAGYPRTGIIGDDESPGSVEPVDIGDGRTATAISAGARHTCALLDGGGVRCWGDGANGQLGYGNTDRIGDDEKPGSVGPVDLGAGRTAVAISAGAYHTCAVLDDGSVRCWGYGKDGQLGYGNTNSLGDDETPASAGAVDLGAGRRAIAVSAGGFHTCALLDDGTVRCWGDGADGRLGYGNTSPVGDDESPDSVGPVSLGAGRRAIAISAGGTHTCAQIDDGSMRCWGDGASGRLGYCNERSVGDDEIPSSVGPVPLETSPSSAYAGCARPADGGAQRVSDPRSPVFIGVPGLSPLRAEAARRRGYRACLRSAARHAKRHRSRLRAACIKRYGRTPGRIDDLAAKALSRRRVQLTFRAPGSHGNLPPAARSYLVKQSRRPILTRAGFRRAESLCKGSCRFPSVTEVGAQINLTIEDLRPRTTYYYAVAARDNISGKLGPRSRAVKVRTR